MIQEEEYEVVGYIKKTCVCDICMYEMQKGQFVATSNPMQYIMKCPKCGKEEYVNADLLNGQWQLKKKILQEDNNE